MNSKNFKIIIGLIICFGLFSFSQAQVALSTDFTSEDHKKEELHNIWSVANRISPTNGSNVRPDLKVNLVRMIGGIKKVVNGQNVPDLDFDPCRYDSLTNTYVYNWTPLISRLNKIVNSSVKILQIVLDQPPWAFQHGYNFIPEGTRDSIHFREDEKMTTYGNSLPPADMEAYHDFIKALMTKLVETYGEELVLSWRFRVGSEIETPDHWKGTEQDFIEHYANTEKAVRAILPEAKVGLHTRNPGFVYKNGTVLNYKGQPIKSFVNGLIEYCYDNNVRYDFWGISDYVLINNKDFRIMTGKYDKLFADLVNHPKWNADATLDLMEYNTVTTMNAPDGGTLPCVTSHKEIIELAFANQFYRNMDNGLEYIYRWGNRPGSANPINIEMLNTMNEKIRYETEIEGRPADANNELDAIFAKSEAADEYDILLYNYNPNSLDYQEKETLKISFVTDLPVGTTLYYRSLQYGKENNTLQNFLEDEPASGWIKDGFDRKGDPSRTLNAAGVEVYSSFANPNPSKYSTWNTIETLERTDGKEGSMMQLSTEIASFAFRKYEFRLTPGTAQKISPAKLQWTSNVDFQTFSSRHVNESITNDLFILNITGNYPAIMFAGDIKASLYDKFRIVLKNESASDIFYLAFYKNDTKYQTRITPNTNETSFNAHILDLSGNANWSGTIESIQIETGNKVGSGIVSIDTIEFLPNKNAGTYTVNLQKEGSGFLNYSSGTCFSGQEFDIEASPNSGWKFDGWTGDISSTDNPVKITVNSDLIIKAIFTEINTAVVEIQAKKLIVYPNPTSNGIFILGEPQKWNVYDFIGACILKGDGDKLDISAYPRGMYLLTTKNDVVKIISL